MHESIQTQLMSANLDICNQNVADINILSLFWFHMDESGLMVRCTIAEGIGVFGEATGGLKLSENHLVNRRFQSDT